MKQIILLFSIVLMSSQAMQAQVLQTERKTVMMKFSEDWCGPCGEWGWTVYDTLLDKEQNDTSFKAYNVTLHSTSSQMFLNSDTMTAAMANNTDTKVPFVPSFVVNTTDMGVTFWTVHKVDTILQKIHQEVAQGANLAVGFTAVLNGDSLMVHTKVKALKALNGHYGITVWIIEDSLYGFQQNLPGVNGYHRMVVRKDVQFGPGGVELQPTGPIAAGKEFQNDFFRKIPLTWNAKHLSYIAIVEHENPVTHKLEVENATKYNSYVTPNPNSVADVYKNNDFTVYPQPAKGVLNVSFTQPAQHAAIALYDMTGRKVADLYQGNISATEPLTVSLPATIANGTYTMQALCDGNTVLKKIIVEQ